MKLMNSSTTDCECLLWKAEQLVQGWTLSHCNGQQYESFHFEQQTKKKSHSCKITWLGGTRWARQVTVHHEACEHYPTIQEFTSFVVKEAEIAYYTVASISAMKTHTSAPFTGSKSTKNTSLTMQVLKPQSDQSKGLCALCVTHKHLDDCFQKLKKTFEQRKEYVWEYKLCYRSSSPGYCLCQRWIETAHKLHPSSLHGDRSLLPNEASTQQAAQVTESITRDATTEQGIMPRKNLTTAVVSCTETQRQY